MQLLVNSGKAKGKRIEVSGPRFLIGRGSECQLRPQSPVVSQRHAELKIIAGITVLIDLDSANGTRVNGQRLAGCSTIRNGDRIEIGPLSFTAIMEEKKRPAKRPRRASEDEVASWLLDENEAEAEAEEDEAPHRPQPRQRPTGGGVGSRGNGDESFKLLEAMKIHPD